MSHDSHEHAIQQLLVRVTELERKLEATQTMLNTTAQFIVDNSPTADEFNKKRGQWEFDNEVI